MSTVINCLNCGNEGVIKKTGGHKNGKRENVFKKLGHNPFSGHLHYQCPACKMVLLIEASLLHTPFPFFVGNTKSFPNEMGDLYDHVGHEGLINLSLASAAVSATSYR